jgi:hypothetical protein
MPGVRNRNVSHKPVVRDRGLTLNDKQLGMNRSTEQSQTQFRDIRSDESDAHGATLSKDTANDDR